MKIELRKGALIDKLLINISKRYIGINKTSYLIPP